MKNDGGPAFPSMRVGDVLTEDGYRLHAWREGGMSLRDYFAAKALAGYCYRTTFEKVGDTWPNYQDIARWAYEQADAMLKAREQS